MKSSEREKLELIQQELEEQLASMQTRQEKTRLVASTMFFGHGIYPTVAKVLSVTRHGSTADVSRDLEAFWQDVRTAGRKRLVAPDMPEVMVEAAQAFIDSAWLTAVDQARAALRDQAAELVEKERQLKAQAEESQRAAELAREELSVALGDVQREAARRVEAERAVADARAAAADLETDRDHWKDRAEEGERQLAKAIGSFSSDLQAMREARDREHEAHKGEIAFAMQQIEAARQAERAAMEVANSERARSEKEIARLNETLTAERHECVAMRVELARLEEQLAQAQRKLAVREAELARKSKPGRLKRELIRNR